MTSPWSRQKAPSYGICFNTASYVSGHASSFLTGKIHLEKDYPIISTRITCQTQVKSAYNTPVPEQHFHRSQQIFNTRAHAPIREFNELMF